MDDMVAAHHGALIGLVAELVSAYVSNNPIPAPELPGLIASTHAALATLHRNGGPERVIEKPTAVHIRRSITPDALISFLDGRPYKTLKRHLNSHGMTFETYRDRYGLPRDYPSTAPRYSAERSALARSLGLGQKRPAQGDGAVGVLDLNARGESRSARGRKLPKRPEAAAAE